MEMLGGNKTSLTLIKDLESQNYIKNIDMIYYYIQKLVENEKLDIKQIFSSNMLTDGFTKALLVGPFKKH